MAQVDGRVAAARNNGSPEAETTARTSAEGKSGETLLAVRLRGSETILVVIMGGGAISSTYPSNRFNHTSGPIDIDITNFNEPYTYLSTDNRHQPTINLIHHSNGRTWVQFKVHGYTATDLDLRIHQSLLGINLRRILVLDQ